MKVSAVSYLNTSPFIYGLENSPEFKDEIELSKDIPSTCAERLRTGDVQLGLVPVAAIPSIPDAHVLPSFCIGAEGKVRTVCLISDSPLEEIETILLDYQSNTSVALCRILCRDYWNIEPTFKSTKEGFEDDIMGTTAAVVIGDRVFKHEGNHKYFTDLSEEWTKWTNLPFVFACWVSRGPLEKEQAENFEAALFWGLEHLEASIDDINEDRDKILDYLMWNISYNFDDKKKEALQKFHELLETLD